jgi:signal transduction histidine kinase
MARHRVPIWVVLFLCFLAIIAVMTTSGFWSRRDYQTFYVDFASEYSLLIRRIEVKDDVDGMYMAAWSLRNGRADQRAAFERNYETALARARAGLALVKGRVEGDMRYRIIDIGNMITTFDETYRELVANLSTDNTLYLTVYARYLQRLQGYIEGEIRAASEALTVEAKGTYDQFSARLDSIARRGNLLMGLTAAACLLAAAWVVRGVSRPIKTLVSRMRHFTRTGEDVAASSGRTSLREVGELVDSYNVLVAETIEKREVERELSRQQVDNLETKSLLKSAELDMLRMQMNPHFLFNTLNSIGALAEMENAPRAGAMVSRLAGILRYSLNDRAQFAPLSEELGVAEDYVAIKKTRFGDRLGYSCRVDPDAMLRPIPRMVVQPLIENAVQHGFPKPKAGDRIEVSAGIEDGALVVVVRDNGAGMSPERLREVLAPREAGARGGIGLENVLQRMRLTYGMGHVSVESAPGRGTVVTLRVRDAAPGPA